MGIREECHQQVKNYPGASFKRFGSMVDANAFATGAEESMSWKEGDDVVYCDGACKGNGQEEAMAGIGIWWGEGDPR